MQEIIKNLKKIHKIKQWNFKKQLTYFFSFLILWTLFVYLIGGEWLYFFPLFVADYLFWETFNYTFWKKRVKKEKKKKSQIRSWVNAIGFAVIAATLLRYFLIEAYTIPTSSMEKSMLIGDFLFVSKVSYGPRVPMTPISFPFAHHTMPFLGGKSYSEAIKLPFHRMKGLGSIKRNDCIVFNWPAEKLGRPIDKKENYVKRCVGIPGDVIRVINGQLMVNNNPQQEPEGMKKQAKYTISSGTTLNEKLLYEKYDINTNHNIIWGHGEWNSDFQATWPNYSFNATEDVYKELKKLPYLKGIVKQVNGTREGSNIFAPPPGYRVNQSNPSGFLRKNPYKWNEDNYGPITIPAAGDTIKLTTENLPLYKDIIKRYEGEEMGDNKRFKNIESIISEKGSALYIIKMNYYWMMGDNRHNSADSRFWGFVPENHIVGKALFVWMSWDTRGEGFNKIRWNRLFRSVK